MIFGNIFRRTSHNAPNKTRANHILCMEVTYKTMDEISSGERAPMVYRLKTLVSKSVRLRVQFPSSSIDAYCRRVTNRIKHPSSAPGSFQLSTLLVNDEFLVENSNKILNCIQIKSLFEEILCFPFYYRFNLSVKVARSLVSFSISFTSDRLSLVPVRYLQYFDRSVNWISSICPLRFFRNWTKIKLLCEKFCTTILWEIYSPMSK